MINKLLARSVELENKLLKFLELRPHYDSEKLTAGRIICSIAFEHAESAKMLIASRNYTSAVALVRLQYDALVRAVWLLYAASDQDVSKLMCELTSDSASKANNLPMLSEMLLRLEGKAPKVALDMLLEFKEYSWKPLSSFIHSGIHAMNRHSNGYPPQILLQVLIISNGVSIMVGMLLIILAENFEHQGVIPAIQREFFDCLPAPKY